VVATTTGAIVERFLGAKLAGAVVIHSLCWMACEGKSKNSAILSIPCLSSPLPYSHVKSVCHSVSLSVSVSVSLSLSVSLSSLSLSLSLSASLSSLSLSLSLSLYLECEPLSRILLKHPSEKFFCVVRDKERVYLRLCDTKIEISYITFHSYLSFIPASRILCRVFGFVRDPNGYLPVSILYRNTPRLQTSRDAPS